MYTGVTAGGRSPRVTPAHEQMTIATDARRRSARMSLSLDLRGTLNTDLPHPHWGRVVLSEVDKLKADKGDLDTRLASIEGHIKGIRKMVQDDTYCVDVLKQTFAVERALQKFEAELLRGHLSTCVPTGFKQGRNEAMIQELTDLFALSRK